MRIGPWIPCALAVCLGAIFGVVELAGWSEYAVVLTGTLVWDAPTNGVVQGLIYVGVRLISVVCAPALLGGAALWWGVDRWIDLTHCRPREIR